MTNADLKLTVVFRREDPLPVPHDIRLEIAAPQNEHLKGKGWKGSKRRGEGEAGTGGQWQALNARDIWLVGCLVTPLLPLA